MPEGNKEQVSGAVLNECTMTEIYENHNTVNEVTPNGDVTHIANIPDGTLDSELRFAYSNKENRCHSIDKRNPSWHLVFSRCLSTNSWDVSSPVVTWLSLEWL